MLWKLSGSGIEGGKKVKVHAVNLSDTKIAWGVLEEIVDKYPSLKAFSGDVGYIQRLTILLNNCVWPYISEKIEGKRGVLPKRWVVGRTFSWLGNFRRFSKTLK